MRAQSLAGLAQLMKDPQRVGASRASGGDLRRGASLWRARRRRSGGDRQVQPRRSGRLPAALAAARQRQDLRRFRPPAGRGPGAARDASSATGRRRRSPRASRASRRRRRARRAPKILLVDRPGAPQSTILGGQLLPIDPYSDVSPFNIANEALGGQFLSRLNMDLRETKGWSYGVSDRSRSCPTACLTPISAPVQADRTADALAALSSRHRRLPRRQGHDPERARPCGDQQRQCASRANSRPRARCSAGSCATI